MAVGRGARDLKMELLLVRVDHFHDRSSYVSVLRKWLEELQIDNGRVISMGSDLLLLFVAATEAQNTKLLEFYRSREIDTNNRGELCVDKFIDVLGRKTVESSGCKGFLEMNVLSPALLQKVLVQEWHAEQEWLDEALATKRTKTFLQWKEAAKAARKERRKKEGQEREQEKAARKVKREQEAAQKIKEEEEDAIEEEESVVKDNVKEEDCKSSSVAQEPSQQGQKRKIEQQPSQKKKKNKSKNKKRRT
ncbi:RWD domain-containing protein 3 [Phytophthora citrophthora]|uniref:RWD domain-containing protein 3 n=1 Tax=Phytophthora citrophthora TaxID=4793 RepID=A0AAD9G5N0_9STRA|nr:RWD domain-containing protein 3 [Phytophthora citrophthora]